MRPLPIHTLELAARLGLGNLNQPKPCHGYQHGCNCAACLKPRKATPAVKQPWQTEHEEAA